MSRPDFTSIKKHIDDAASTMPDLSQKQILMGFWHNWRPGPGGGHGDGYQGGTFYSMPLEEVPEQYNVVAVAFMKGAGIPTFQPDGYSDAEFRRQVGVLNSQGRAVLISLGGADAHIELGPDDGPALAKEIARLVEVYGFDGLDIDLEQAAIDAGANKTVIPEALKLVRHYYESRGQHFFISMAPEFPYLMNGGKYIDYIRNLDGYYDLIAPQYYNQGGDGIWVPEADDGKGRWVAQNDDEYKEDFLFYLTKALVSDNLALGLDSRKRKNPKTAGTAVYIPAHKFAIGLPTNNDAAATGYVIDPTAVYNAFARLKAADLPIKGLMTWSANWDNGTPKNSTTPYGWEFINRYGPLIHDEQGGGERPPSTPAGLNATGVSQTGLTLGWRNSSGSHPIAYYLVRRNGTEVGRPTTASFVDSGLSADSEYGYTVQAWDEQGQASAASAELRIKTLGEDTGPGPDPEPEFPQWVTGTNYVANNGVTYNGKQYICLQNHTSQTSWNPEAAQSLWQPQAMWRGAMDALRRLRKMMGQ
ncbi:carbohydrate-binding protein [Pseudomonas sp. nanlin1]|uniref:carbohydrate-binding protein n=1 Tax=Pseudomonas sp. nanlin1 TaxID=3040605 RepID=UPI00388F9EC4